MAYGTSKIFFCTSCGMRAMCITRDNGYTYTCNRCTVSYRIQNENVPEKDKIVAQPIFQVVEKKETPTIETSEDNKSMTETSETNQNDEPTKPTQRKPRQTKSKQTRA